MFGSELALMWLTLSAISFITNIITMKTNSIDGTKAALPMLGTAVVVVVKKVILKK